MANGHGGKRKGAGRRTGSKMTETVREQLAITRAQNKLRLGVELLSELANYCRGMMGKYQPGGPEENEERFLRFMKLTGRFAADVASYESAKHASLTVREVPYDLSRLSDNELAEFERIARTAAIADRDSSGEGSSVH